MTACGVCNSPTNVEDCSSLTVVQRLGSCAVAVVAAASCVSAFAAYAFAVAVVVDSSVPVVASRVAIVDSID